MRDGNSFPLVCVCFQVILAYESIVLCKCSGNVLIGYENFLRPGEVTTTRWASKILKMYCISTCIF